MYQEEIKENPSILKKYILVGELNLEWIVRLYSPQDYKPSFDILADKPEPIALAVYRPTGRIFIEKSSRVWEYEYAGIRISA